MSEISDSHWGILDTPPNDGSTVSYEFFETDEQQGAGAKPKSQKLLVFENKDTDEYILPSAAYIPIRVRIRKADESALGARAALMNSGMLFSRCEYLVNGKSIEIVENCNYTTLIKNLLEYSDDYGRAGATDQLWFKDTSDGGSSVSHYTTTTTTDEVHTTKFKDSADAESATFALSGGDGTIKVTGAVTNGAGSLVTAVLTSSTSTTINNATYNDGYAKRSNLSAGVAGTADNYVLLKIPLRRLFGFCTLDKVSIGSRHQIRLTRAESVECTMATADTALHVHIEKISIFVFALIPNASFTSNTANKAVFRHSLLTEIHVKVGSFRYPNSDIFRCNFDETTSTFDYEWIHHEYLRCSNKLFDVDSGPAISFKEFKDTYPIFCFNLRNQED
eukprot:Lithocolla_globosa_v1_NODE_204_length_5187_cov_37.604053.p1 type:complete len:391 gc:universal NODE_204_length_5187_cov_37.604053:3696-2524(-)